MRGLLGRIKRRALHGGYILLRTGYRHYRHFRLGPEGSRRLLAELVDRNRGFEAMTFELAAARRERDHDVETLSSELATVRHERDRMLRSLEALRIGRVPLPPGLRGRQLCFLHIGKTAGTSVQHALFEMMHGAAILHESLPKFDTVSAAEIAINDLVIGHFGYQHVVKMRADRFLMTFLRDPIERVLSNYFFLRTDSQISRYSEPAINAARALTLSEFLRCEEPSVRMFTENFQAKALAFDVRPEHQSAIADLHREAAGNLSTFDFVGVVEYFTESMFALSDLLGRELSIKNLNATAARSSASAVAPADLDLIRRLNAVDIALYTAARTRFEQTVLPTLRSRGAAAGRAALVAAPGRGPPALA